MQSYRPPGHFSQTTLEFFATHHSPFWRFGEHARITFQIRHQRVDSRSGGARLVRSPGQNNLTTYIHGPRGHAGTRGVRGVGNARGRSEMPGCRVTVMVRSGARDVEIQSQAFSGVRSAKYLVSMSSRVPRTSNKWPGLVDDLHRRVAKRERRPRRDVGVFVAHRSITTSGRPGARGPPPTGPARVAGAPSCPRRRPRRL